MLVSQRFNRLEMNIEISRTQTIRNAGLYILTSALNPAKPTYWLFLVQKYTKNSLQAHACQSAYTE